VEKINRRGAVFDTHKYTKFRKIADFGNEKRKDSTDVRVNLAQLQIVIIARPTRPHRRFADTKWEALRYELFASFCAPVPPTGFVHHFRPSHGV